VGIKIAVNKINEDEKEKKYKPLLQETSKPDPGTTTYNPNDSVRLLKVYEDTTALPPPTPTATGPDRDNNQSRFKDDDGLTAEDAVNSFFNAFNNSDCNKAWNMTYNTYWVQQGEDWFCSPGAFGGVNKVLVSNIYPVVQTADEAEINVGYYAQDIYNGNKCFKQTIIVQKIAYTDNKLRWRITKMKNIESPVACNENQ
jgi:hypothetical protein